MGSTLTVPADPGGIQAASDRLGRHIKYMCVVAFGIGWLPVTSQNTQVG